MERAGFSGLEEGREGREGRGRWANLGLMWVIGGADWGKGGATEGSWGGWVRGNPVWRIFHETTHPEHLR